MGSRSTNSSKLWILFSHQSLKHAVQLWQPQMIVLLGWVGVNCYFCPLILTVVGLLFWSGGPHWMLPVHLGTYFFRCDGHSCGGVVWGCLLWVNCPSTPTPFAPVFTIIINSLRALGRFFFYLLEFSLIATFIYFEGSYFCHHLHRIVVKSF